MDATDLRRTPGRPLRALAPPGARVCINTTVTMVGLNTEAREGDQPRPAPPTPGSHVRLPGSGSTRALEGLKPDEYWVRAASVKGQIESPFCQPVKILIR